MTNCAVNLVACTVLWFLLKKIDDAELVIERLVEIDRHLENTYVPQPVLLEDVFVLVFV